MRHLLQLINLHTLHRVVPVLLSTTMLTVMLTACAPVRPLADAPVAKPPVLPAYTNPVFDGDFPDPFVLQAADGYYAYSTSLANRHIQVIYSKDLFTWELSGDQGNALPDLPAWSESGRTWAPSVLAVGDKYILYYSTHHGTADLQCISYAVSNSPAGPFVDESDGPFLCQVEEGGSIDPEPFIDVDGSLYLLWKSDANALELDPWIYSQRLSDDGRTLLGEPVRLITRDQDWEEPLVENPSMVLHEGVYYLIYSANWWEGGNYALGYAICDSPSGPCEKPWDEPFFAIPTNQIGGEIGPGGASFFHDHDGSLWIAYHAWRSPSAGYVSGGQRRLSIARIEFLDNEPLVLRPELATEP